MSFKNRADIYIGNNNVWKPVLKWVNKLFVIILFFKALDFCPVVFCNFFYAIFLKRYFVFLVV